MREKDLKLAVSEYLQYGTNQGKWYADRLNSGAVYVKRGNKTYAVMLCREGTADFFSLQGYIIKPEDVGKLFCKVKFSELKGDKGKQSQQQKGFQLLVEAQGAEYHIVKSIEDLEAIL